MNRYTSTLATKATMRWQAPWQAHAEQNGKPPRKNKPRKAQGHQKTSNKEKAMPSAGHRLFCDNRFLTQQPKE
jgi:hypothetical protein